MGYSPRPLPINELRRSDLKGEVNGIGLPRPITYAEAFKLCLGFIDTIAFSSFLSPAFRYFNIGVWYSILISMALSAAVILGVPRYYGYHQTKRFHTTYRNNSDGWSEPESPRAMRKKQKEEAKRITASLGYPKEFLMAVGVTSKDLQQLVEDSLSIDFKRAHRYRALPMSSERVAQEEAELQLGILKDQYYEWYTDTF